jgi:hypothetical protein
VNAPALEAAELADKLSSREDAVLKKTLVSLQKLVRVGLTFICVRERTSSKFVWLGRAIRERVS